MIGMQSPIYIHVGVGEPHKKSHVVFFSEIPTSMALRKSIYSDYTTYSATLYTSIAIIAEKFGSYAVQRYESRGRTYYVFPCNELCELFNRAIGINYWIVKHAKYKLTRKIVELFNDALSANSVNEMLDKLRRVDNELSVVDEKLNKRITVRREVFFNRFKHNHERNKPIIDKYFPELLPPRIYEYAHSFGRFEDTTEYLEKLGFEKETAQQYDLFTYDHGAVIVIPRGTNHIEILTRAPTTIENLSIYADSCKENETTVACKLVAVDHGTHKILWVAVISYDKITNQRLIQYVPTTLVLQDVEACMHWLSTRISR